MEKIIFHLKCISSIITLHESGSLQLGTEEGSVAGGGRFKEYECCRQLGLHAGVRAGGGSATRRRCHCQGLPASNTPPSHFSTAQLPSSVFLRQHMEQERGTFEREVN